VAKSDILPVIVQRLVLVVVTNVVEVMAAAAVVVATTVAMVADKANVVRHVTHAVAMVICLVIALRARNVITAVKVRNHVSSKDTRLNVLYSGPPFPRLSIRDIERAYLL
jgi:hypothetical protein